MRRFTAVSLSAAFFTTLASDAQACGGFFCNQGQPMDQAGEEIVFASDGTTVTAHIRISYQGSAEDFAWILPLPSEPRPPEVGSDELFTQLRTRMVPRFNVRFDWSRSCTEDSWLFGDASGGEGEAEAEAEAEAEGEGVDVSFRGAVGPYDAAVLSSDDPTALVTWLTDNGYDIPPGSPDLIAHYVEIDHWFVALKLLSDSDVGDLQPIVVSFEFDRPCVPLVLTAIAAVEDMDIRLWVLGDSRSIPVNYRHVLIDEAKIDWLCGGTNYQDVVTQAANEADGRAFVTEYAGPSDLMAETLYWTDRYDVSRLAAATHPVGFVEEVMNQSFPRDPILLAVLQTHIPPRPGEEATGLFNDIFWYCSCSSPSDCECPGDPSLDDYLSGLSFDSGTAAADIEARIVQPLQAAQAMFDENPYLTQMFTTISPDEMVLDPMFSFNAELPDVGLTHTADVYLECHDDIEYRRILLVDGREIWVHPEDATCAGPDPEAPIGTLARLTADLPGSERAEDLPELLGQGEVVYTNTEEINRILDEHNDAVSRRVGLFPASDSGCSCDLGRAPLASLSAFALGLAFLWRPRRRNR